MRFHSLETSLVDQKKKQFGPQISFVLELKKLSNFIDNGYNLVNDGKHMLLESSISLPSYLFPVKQEC